MQNSICHSLWRGGYAQRRVIPVERHEFGIAVIPVALFQPVSLDKPRAHRIDSEFWSQGSCQ